MGNISMAASIKTLVDLDSKFRSATAKPENFLSVQKALLSKFINATKTFYDYGNKESPIKGISGILPELYTEGFDEGQVWQQLELHHKSAEELMTKVVAKLGFHKNHMALVKTTREEVPEVVEEIEKDEESGSELSDIPDVSDGEDSDTDIDETHLLKFDEYKVLEEDDRPEKLPTSEPKKHKKSEVDDDFFKLGEMEEFLQKEEAEQKPKGEDNEDDIDLFEMPSEEEDSQDEAITAKYSDFFKGSMLEESRKKKRNRDEDSDMDGGEDGEDMDDEEGEEESEEEDDDGEKEPKGKRVKFNLGSAFSGEESSEEEEEDDEDAADPMQPEVKSSFEQRQERLKSRIEDLENEAIGPKPWQLAGETSRDLRPDNALLEEDLYFDHTTRVAPVITEETTRTLEDLIKQRIKDQAYDDVERKVKPVYDPSEYKKKLVLDQEKSKFSLAEIYEQDYLKKQEEQEKTPQTSSLADPIVNKEKEDKAHAVISKMMTDVFSKLDALSNFHYTPKMPIPEVKIVSNMPSIVMEEIAPVTVSDANLLAPEEVQDHVRGEEKSTTEKEKTDRLRERRKKKSAQRIRHKEAERIEKAVDKANPGLGNKHAKNNALRQLQQAEKEGTVTLIKDNDKKSLKSSTAFFNQLQENVASEIKEAKTGKAKSKLNKKHVSASKLKL